MGLDPFALAKTVSSGVKKVKEVKEIVSTLNAQIAELKKDYDELKAGADAFKDSNKFLEGIKKCNASGKKTCQECYEHIYGKIEPPAKSKSESSCCCVTF